MAPGEPSAIWYVAICPEEVMRPIRRLSGCVNQSAPSGPEVMPYTSFA